MKKIIAVLMALSLASAANAASAKIPCYCSVVASFLGLCSCDVNSKDAAVWGVCADGAEERGLVVISKFCQTCICAAFAAAGAAANHLINRFHGRRHNVFHMIINIFR